jgi:signal recognition particle subunit SRP54
MRAVTGRPIKLIGVGEKMDALEAFHPDRIANRILGMGDVVGLVEKAQESIQEEDAKKLAARMKKGEFDLEDLRGQLQQMQKMGGLEGLAGMLPGARQVKQQLADANIDPKMLRRQEAIIGSMTPKERRNPKLINASRKKRIAAGSGTTVPDVNRVLKQWKQMSVMMKKVRKLGKSGMMRAGLQGILPRM